MIKAVVFDLDNTLLDFMKIKKASVDAAVAAMISAGLKMSKEESNKVLEGLYDQYGIEYQEIFQKFLEKVDNKVDYRILSEGIVAYRKVQSGLLEPYPHVVPTLVKLRTKGLKLGILSDAPRLKGWIRLTEMKLAEFFDVVITYDDTGEHKPSKVPFLRMLKELDIDPSEAIMVGDSPKRDIVGAKNSGMATVFARYGCTKHIELSGADFDINGIEQIVDVIDKL